MRQTDGTSIETISTLLKLAECRGSLRKEVQIVAGSQGVSEIDVATWMGVNGLYYPSGGNGFQHRADSLSLLRGRGPARLPEPGAEAALAGSALADVPLGRQHSQAANGSGKAHSHPKVKLGRPLGAVNKSSKAWHNPDGTPMNAAQRAAEQKRRNLTRAKNKLAKAKAEGKSIPKSVSPKVKPTAKSTAHKIGFKYPEGQSFGLHDLEALFRRYPSRELSAKELLPLVIPSKRKAAVGNLPPALVALTSKGILTRVGPGVYRLNKKAKAAKPTATKTVRAMAAKTVTKKPVTSVPSKKSPGKEAIKKSAKPVKKQSHKPAAVKAEPAPQVAPVQTEAAPEVVATAS